MEYLIPDVFFVPIDISLPVSRLKAIINDLNYLISFNVLKVNRTINNEFGIAIPIPIMFRLPTISSIADYILKGDNKLEEIKEGLDEREEALSILNTNDE